MSIPDDITKTVSGIARFSIAGWEKRFGLDEDIATALHAERQRGEERLREAERLLRQLSDAALSILVGAAIHNDRGGTPKIEGPLVTMLSDKAQEARAFLAKEGK